MDNKKRAQLTTEGPEFSSVAAGVWKWGSWGHQLTPQEILSLIKGSLDLSVTTFDHADIYGDYTDEAAFGKALAMEPSLRQQIEIVTKCGIKLTSENRPNHRIKSYDTSREHIIWSVENSLRDLKTDYLDLLLIHRPDPLLDPDEVAEAIEDLKKEGKVKHFGVSNFTPSQFDMLNSRVPLCTNQVEVSLIHLDTLFDGTLDQALEYRFRPMAWSPLGSGKLFGQPDNAHDLKIQEAAKAMANKYEIKLDQLLLAWLLKHPSRILPVLGTAKIDRIADAAESLEVDLKREDWFELLEVVRGREID